MLQFARPGFLVAGLLLALLPPLLHLIARRPRERLALPTARFLRTDARTTVSLRRRPTDIVLLLLRSLFLLLLAAACAGPAWQDRRAGTLDLVLLDRAVGAGWAAAVDSARARLLPDRGTPRGDLLIFDTLAVRIAARELTPALFDSLSAAGPAATRAEYAVALRAAREAAREQPGIDSLRLTLVTRPRWEGWSPGLGRLREAAWPGGIRLVPIETPAGEAGETAGGTETARAGPRSASVLAGDAGGAYLEAALTALGWTVTDGADAGAGRPGLQVAVPPLSEAMEAGLLAAARAGVVVIVAGEPPAGPLGSALPWEPGAPPSDAAAAPGALLLDDGMAIEGAATRISGAPRPAGRVLAAWEDGRPAAAGAREGAGCLVYLGTAPEAGGLPLSPDFPALLERLSRGCEPADPRAGGSRGPLDSGARTLLEGRTPGAAAPAAAFDGADPGRPLDRWLLLAALGVALGEAGLAYAWMRR